MLINVERIKWFYENIYVLQRNLYLLYRGYKNKQDEENKKYNNNCQSQEICPILSKIRTLEFDIKL